MPLMKLYVNRDQPDAVKVELAAALVDLRALVCERLDVPLSAAHLAVIEHASLPDQPQINVEVKYLARPDRTADHIRAVASALREMVATRTGLTPAIRMAMLRPEEYFALK